MSGLVPVVYQGRLQIETCERCRGVRLGKGDSLPFACEKYTFALSIRH